VEAWLAELGRRSGEGFEHSRRLLGYGEYLAEVAREPHVHLRDAASWLVDVFEHFGRRVVVYPWGEENRFVLFDQDFPGGGDSLVGQERVQNEFFRALKGFVRDGRPTRMILLHGPNGSSKSTFIGCVMRAMERYSALDEGARYRFGWVFPKELPGTGKLGFNTSAGGVLPGGSLAHLDESEVEARLSCDLRDHPLLVLPSAERRAFLASLLGEREVDRLPDLFASSGLCPKCKLVFDALMTAYRGNVEKVLGHVQVERYFVSRGYRRGAVTIGPQMSVDAGERQVTMDQSLSMLPRMLARLSLYEFQGDLVDGSGGLVEFSDMLKRPLEAIKYLISTLETGEVSTAQNILRIDAVMVGTTNEIQLASFRKQAEYLSFLGRLDLVKVPYILSGPVEREIYTSRVVPNITTHVAPHAVRTAAAWGVISRLHRPDEEDFEGPLAQIAPTLTAFEKLHLYSESRVPERFDAEQAAELLAGLPDIRSEFDQQVLYEGGVGASPREVKYVLDRAAQAQSESCLTPMGVLREIVALAERAKDFPFLSMESQPGGFFDQETFIEGLTAELLDALEVEALEASGLVAPEGHDALWRRYVLHATAAVKGEKLYNEATGESEPPDVGLLEEVEGELGVDDPDDFRQDLMSRIAAFAIDNPSAPMNFVALFHHHVAALKKKQVQRNYGALAELIEQVMESGPGDEPHRLLAGMMERHGYCPACGREALATLLAGRLRQAGGDGDDG
jgi:predicted Ser/Thr protein kinase